MTATNEWRTPNTIALRIQQRGEVFHCHVEHCTHQWRAGAGIIGRYDKARDRMEPKELRCGQVYTWSLRYDPGSNGESGTVTATLGGETTSYQISPQHKSDGAEFNHFGLVNVMKQFDRGGRLWLDNVTINGAGEEFGSDPKWDASGNRRSYETRNVRPRFDFGFTPTHYAGHVLGAPKISRITVRFISDGNAVLANMLSGDVTLAADVALPLGFVPEVLKQWGPGRGSAVLHPGERRFLHGVEQRVLFQLQLREGLGARGDLAGGHHRGLARRGRHGQHDPHRFLSFGAQPCGKSVAGVRHAEGFFGSGH